MGGQAMAPQTGDECLGFPVTKRNVIQQSLAHRCPSGLFGKLGIG